MFRIPRWSQWLLGSLTLLTVAGVAVLVPAVRDARNAARKSQDK